ncbi:MAG: cupin domain-containing protein [Candidatus Binatia bacterium]
MKVVKLNAALKSLKKISEEIGYANCFVEEQFTSGVIIFQPVKSSDRKPIIHDDKDVVCYVLRGSGRLRAEGTLVRLRPGTICHIPKRMPHDFMAGKKSELVLFYSLIKTGRPKKFKSQL